MTRTGANNLDEFYRVTSAGAERYFPCWCGEDHDGDYGHYDFGHHNCHHSLPLYQTEPDIAPDILMCPECGKGFSLEIRKDVI